MLTPGYTTNNLAKGEIAEIFKADIENNSKLAINRVHSKMCTTVSLRVLSTKTKRVKQVMNRIAYLQKVQPWKNPEELEAGPSRASVWSFDGGSTTRKASAYWDDDETKAINDAFPELSCPRKADIKARFFKDEALYHIMQERTFQRCYEKVKSLIKSRNRK